MSDAEAGSALFEDGDIAVRLMRDDDDDVALLARWLSDERILEFYEGRDQAFDEAKVREKFGPRARGESRTASCIIERGNAPIGYIQFYGHDEAGHIEYAIPPDTAAYGIDIFIGEPELWGGGLGSRAVAAMASYLVNTCGAALVTIDPAVINARAIRTYEKAGFSKVRVLPAHEMHEGERRDSWLMVSTP